MEVNIKKWGKGDATTRFNLARQQISNHIVSIIETCIRILYQVQYHSPATIMAKPITRYLLRIKKSSPLFNSRSLFAGIVLGNKSRYPPRGIP